MERHSKKLNANKNVSNDVAVRPAKVVSMSFAYRAAA
jgi:hypothetical protein